MENEKRYNDDYKFLKNFHIFKFITKLSLHKLLKFTKKKQFKKGQKVFFEVDIVLGQEILRNFA